MLHLYLIAINCFSFELSINCMKVEPLPSRQKRHYLVEVVPHLLDRLALRHVFDDPRDPADGTVLLGNREDTSVDPAQGAVRAHDPVLQIVFGPRHPEHLAYGQIRQMAEIHVGFVEDHNLPGPHAGAQLARPAENRADLGRGIEEHFGMEGTVDIKMGTLSKTIPSVGGYVAGKKELITYLRHASRAYIFSAALPPAQAAAANEAFKVILDEPWRIERLNENTKQFIGGLKSLGFDTMLTTTAIVPVLCQTDERAFALTRECQHHDLFVLPVVSPAVPEGLARLRATVLASHEPQEIDYALGVIAEAGKKLGIIE